MAIYKFYNGPMVTTASPATVGLSAATIKTLLQFKPGATTVARIIEWGFSGDASAAATPGVVELIETDVAATVTAFVANDITKADADALMAGDPTTSQIAVGTTSSGYTATAEGTTTASRLLACPQLIAPTTQFSWQSPLGQEALVQPGKFARIRAKFPATVNIFCYMIVSL